MYALEAANDYHVPEPIGGLVDASATDGQCTKHATIKLRKETVAATAFR